MPDNWWNDPNFNAPVPTEGDSAMTDADLLALLGGGTQTNGQFVTLPNGHYVLIDPKSGRIIQDFGAKPAAALGTGGPTGGQQLGFQQDMAALAEQQRQFDLTQGERKARGDQQMILDSELGRGQLDVSRGNLDVNRGNLGVNQGQLALQQATQAFKQYSDLANLASNPRNFVQSFFMNRGYTPPPDVARYGNTPSNAAGIMPYSQFAQQQGLMGAGGAPQRVASAPLAAAAPTYANPVVSQTGVQYPQGTVLSPNGTGVYGSSYQGLSGFDAATGKPRLSPTDPDAAGLMARNPGMYAMTSQEEVMKYLPQKPRMMAKGGVLHMTGPHAVIDLMSGKIRAIAGEAGEENAYFDGAAIIDPGMAEDPYQDQYMPGYGPNFQTGIESTYQQPSGSQYYPGTEPSPYSPAPIPDGSIPQQTAPVQSWTPEDLAAMIAAANAGNATLQPQTNQLIAGTPTAPTPYVAPPPPTGPDPYAVQTAAVAPLAQPITPQIQPLTTTQPPPTEPTGPGGWAGATGPEAGPVGGIAPSAYTQFQQQQTTAGGATPIDFALGGSGQTALPVGTPTATNPQNASVPGSNAPTFGQPIPSRMPTYLAGEDFQGQSDVLRGLQAGGAVPPFLQRAFGQARGDQQYATNTPQRTDLPPDLPLLSRLAWEQMAPSEQQAYLSYASALGVTPEDYLALVFGGSPQGGAASSPLFGAPLTWNRQ